MSTFWKCLVSSKMITINPSKTDLCLKTQKIDLADKRGRVWKKWVFSTILGEKIIFNWSDNCWVDAPEIMESNDTIFILWGCPKQKWQCPWVLAKNPKMKKTKTKICWISPNFGEHDPQGFSETCCEAEAKICSFEVSFFNFGARCLFWASLNFSYVAFNFCRENWLSLL